MLRTIPRAMVTSYLSVVRLPFDLTASVLTRGDSAPKLTIDRAEAAARAFAGTLLRDDELKADAQRRRMATDERARAIELRVAAKRKAGAAQEQFEQRQSKVDKQRQQAEQDAEAKRAQAERDADAERQRVAAQEQRRQEATEKQAAEKQKALDEVAKRARLEQLDREAEALADREKALLADKTADRLKGAAGAAKAARKS